MNGKLRYLSHTRLVYNLTLGEDYIIHIWGKPAGICRFIQPTQKGFNFLNLETSKCVLKHHIYPSKNYPTAFYLHSSILFMKVPQQIKTAR